MAVLDLDQFKPVNDEYGHHAGDTCLTHFAEVLGRKVRGGDWIARWGGDEFVVGIWHAQEEGSLSVERMLERVAKGLRENPVVLPNGEEALLTFSGGVCQWQPMDDSGRLLAKADAALYRAKVKGGDTVIHAD